MKKTKILTKILIKDYEIFVNEIAELSGIAYHYKTVFDQYILWAQTLKDTEIKKNDHLAKFILGSGLFHHSPYTGRLVKTSGNVYAVNQDNLKKRVAVLEAKSANYLIVNGFESLEKFLKTICSIIIAKNPKYAITVDQRLGYSSQKSAYLFLASQFRNPLDVLKLLRKLIFDFDQAFKTNEALNNYFEFYKTVALCRNHIVHSNGFINRSSSNVSRLSNLSKKYLKKYFEVDLNLNKKSVFINSSRNAKEVLESLVEVGYLIITSIDASYRKSEL